MQDQQILGPPLNSGDRFTYVNKKSNQSHYLGVIEVSILSRSKQEICYYKKYTGSLQLESLQVANELCSML